MRLLAISLLAALLGCSTTRTITIASRPAGATIEVDGGVYRAKSPLTYQFTWETETDSHRVEAILPGYRPEPRAIPRDYGGSTLLLEMRPEQKTLTITVQPSDAAVSVNEKPLPASATGTYTVRDLPFTQDQRSGQFTTYKITAERTGFKPAVRAATFADRDTNYSLELQPMEKEINISTEPPGAEIFFDNESIGKSPVKNLKRQFPFDVIQGKYYPHSVRAKLAGYPEAKTDIEWDDGKIDYSMNLDPEKKSIKIHTNPPGGIVTLEGRPYEPDSSGDTNVTLAFPPMKTYSGTIKKAKVGTSEWKPLDITIGWDNNQKEYSFTLPEIRIMPLALRTLSITRGPEIWDISSKVEMTTAGKDTTERSGLDVQRFTPSVVKGMSIDSLAISPDGRYLLFTVLVEKPKLHSLLYLMRSDGSAAPELLNDGESLDVTPSFSSDGEKILFSSDRAGSHLNICSIPIGGRAVEQYLSETHDLWPSMDSSPKPRIFYQAFSDRLPNPGLFSRPIDLASRTDLRAPGGMQPRINPQNDALLYCVYNDDTQKRDIWRMSIGDRGGMGANVTNSPEIDDYDPSWDRVGARMAYASDQGVDEDKRHNADIWIQDLTQPNSPPTQITSNPSQDDRPVWDPSGRAIYFRSNRGGEWGIWKISLK